jgi:hypothetical protein
MSAYVDGSLFSLRRARDYATPPQHADSERERKGKER